MSGWRTDAKFNSMDDRAVVHDEKNYPVCYVTLNYMEYEKHVKRCHLIAAAPELYEALEAIVSSWSDMDGIEEDEYIRRSNARNALSKARGEHK